MMGKARGEEVTEIQESRDTHNYLSRVILLQDKHVTVQSFSRPAETQRQWTLVFGQPLHGHYNMKRLTRSYEYTL